MKIEANTLQEAFQKAAEQLNCSVTQLDIKVLQHPSSGFFGFFKRSAIIEANLENQPKLQHKPKNDKNFVKKNDENEAIKEDKKQAKKHDHCDKKRGSKKHRDEKSETKFEQKEHKNEKSNLSEKNEALAKDAFAQKSEEEAEPGYVIKRLDEPKEIKESQAGKNAPKNILDNSIIENFNQTDEESAAQALQKEKKEKATIDFDKILPEIKDGMNRLFKASCFDISKIEVSKFDDETVLIELDGADAALLIGKEGYRYKAISYMLYNWLNSKYDLAIRLEIAQFLQNQEAIMEQYLNGVIERVQNTGRAQTKPLDGVLVKIALEKLRQKFPDKYVGIKSGNDGKFVVVNDFFKK
ncbi:Jag N-terminal domain-containing protein [Campylobacter concisus]|uniref:Putative RNA-binding protein (Jag domain) n=1 Tax=Campylobacter concisus TaxID=199 RepID=A0A0M4SU60_9BACT|nr:Jag N-terminal domain-containing protein [Campylobacter concisus]ALF47441.1 putative RNA-binding protein (Jag domain) [Campylobacter concisus]